MLVLIAPASAQEDRTDEDSTRYYQYYRADESLFLKGRLGLNFYGGDRDINPDNEFQKYIENIGFSLGLEVGYHFTDRFSIGLMHLSGFYPRIRDDEDENGVPYQRPAYGVIDEGTTSRWRHHFSLVGRSYVLPQKRVSPYGQMGFNISFGKINDELRVGVGPTVGIGLDTAVSDRLGVFLELNGILDFSDEALDLADTKSKKRPGASRGIDASDFDSFTFFGFGLRLNMRSPFVPVTVECTGPTTLIPNEAGTFTATINEDATRPVELSWDFSDGGTASGLLATHAFTRPGNYTVTVTATNRKSMATATCPVEVLAPPTVAITATPSVLSMCDRPLPPVQFRSTVTGAPPITYRWDFGDGNTSADAEPSHTYTRLDAEPDTLVYTATLRVSNVAGSATASVDVAIAPCPCVDLAELGQACFERNASVLPPGQSLQNLRDNLEILLNNPSILILIEGYASPNERNAQALADDRARAVRDFYVSGGIDPARITIEGIVQEQASKSGPVCTLTIPLPCDDDERARFLQQRQQEREQN
ncbi:MAG: PKD domain-containing protein [Rhodothermales bacterium]